MFRSTRATVLLVMLLLVVGASLGATQIPPLWTAGGLSSGSDSAGQAARLAVDTSGNVAVVSGPSLARDLAVTSYTPAGVLRWRGAVSPASGTYLGNWIASVPNGDFIAIGTNVNSRGSSILLTMVRFSAGGKLLWRKDLTASFFPSIGRLIVDAGGNAYIAWSARGSGLFVQKYSPAGDLLWSQTDSTGSGFAVATSLALSPDESDVVVSGDVPGGATWITAAYDTSTGVRNWQVAAAEGTAARDVVVDDNNVYVAGQGVTGAGTPAIAYFLTVVAYDRTTGARLWRRDKKPSDGGSTAGLWMAKAPDGSLVVTGQALRGFLDWYTVSFETNGAVRWEAVRDGGLNTDEIPAGILVMADGTTVVTGRGGPYLPGGFIQGVTAGYSPNGTLIWEAFSRLETVWATELPNGDVCATGGYDAFITCFRISGGVSAVMTADPTMGAAPLSVTFDGSGSSTTNGQITSWEWSFGDGDSGTGAMTTHTYTNPGNYTATLTVTDSNGATGTATGSIVVNSLPPDAPAQLTAFGLSYSSIRLQWTNGSTSQDEIRIERCTRAMCTVFEQVAVVKGSASTFIDTGLAAATTYRYRVRAHNAAGDSAYSNIARGKTFKR